MRNSSKFMRLLMASAIVLPVLVLAAKTLPASFSTPPTFTHVQIDGVDYGRFDKIDGLKGFSPYTGKPMAANSTYSKVTLSREFITDPSLYLWAKDRANRKVALKDIHLVTLNESGKEIDRQTLELCQPLSWTVEITNSSLGGFNETIDLAVQKVSIH